MMVVSEKGKTLLELTEEGVWQFCTAFALQSAVAAVNHEN